MRLTFYNKPGKYNIEHAEYHKEEREERDVYIEVGGVDGDHNFSAQECYRHTDRYLEQFEQAHGDYAGEHCFMLSTGSIMVKTHRYSPCRIGT